jgi:glycosyltransferase involved in cell wall biosynthesis
MKNIVIVHHYGGLGGAGKSLFNNVKLLSEKYKVTVILPNRPDDMINMLSSLESVDLIEYESIPSLPIYSGGYKWFDPRLYFHLLKSIRGKSALLSTINSINADIIVVNSLITSWLSHYLTENKTICFVRETKVKSPFSLLQKYFLNKFNKVIFISKFDADSWKLTTNFETIRNFSEINYNSYSDSQTYLTGKIKLLFLGGTSYIKGFYFLIFALLRTKNSKHFEITVIGEVNFKVVKVIGKLLDKSLNIKFVGKVKNVDKYYHMSDVIIFPVIKVHQGRPIFEAGFHNKPVIVPSFDNFKEYVKDGFNGLVYYKSSSKSLASIFDSIHNQKTLLIQMGKHNREMSLKNHSKLEAEEKILNLFDSLE